MRILIIGKSESARAFSDYFAKNENNLVFSTINNTNANFIDIRHDDVDELLDFALANDINLSVICDISLINSDFNIKFSEKGLSIFCPENDSHKIATSRVFGKRFMYKNKIKTPKFGIFDKNQGAIDYVRSSNFPLNIMNDTLEEIYPITFNSTFSKAKNSINKLFDMNIKQVVIENYIDGNEFSLYCISDGYNVFELDYVTTYKNKIAHLGANWLSDSIKKDISKNIVEKTISSLTKSNKNYVGILGFNFVCDFNNNVYLKSYLPFFDDLSALLFTSSYKDDEIVLFNGAITGSMKDELYKVGQSTMEFISIKTDDGILTSYGRTLNEAKQKLLDLTGDDDISKIV